MNCAREAGLALVVCWSSDGDHLGETLCVPRGGPSAGWIFGASDAHDSRADRLHLTRRRPGSVEARLFQDSALASAELALSVLEGGIDVRRLGNHRLIAHAGQRAERVLVALGETVEIEDHLLLLCVAQPAELPGAAPNPALHPFGRSDAHGLVGESPAAWKLRERIAFMAQRSGHLLLLGQTGTGKELVAAAVHALSPRGHRPLIARNAAVFPPGLVDAELFGSAPNYPNVGSPERPGLIGQAHGSALFLDEVGELPHELQAHLLRVLDLGGEYHRLGESRSRTADIRIMGATARSPEELRLDFGARFRLRLELPSLHERRQDIPLLARHLLTQAAKSDPIVERLLGGGSPCFGVRPALMRFLVTHEYRAHVRELDALLWRALANANGCLDLSDDLMTSAGRTSRPPLATEKRSSRPPPTAGEIRASLQRHGGVQERAWRDLGLTSRHALKRLIRKYDLRMSISPSDSES